MRQDRVARFAHGNSPSVCYAPALSKVGKSIYIHESKYGCWIFTALFISLLFELAIILPIWWLLFSVPYVVLHLRHVLDLCANRVVNHSPRILIEDCDVWHVILHDGRRFRGKFIKQNSCCTQLFIVWHIKCYTYNWDVLIFRDAINEAEYRYLAARFHCG